MTEQGKGEETVSIIPPQGTGSLPPPDRDLAEVPWVEVLGRLDDSLAIRLGWAHGVRIVSGTRLRFLREELSVDVRDNPAGYIL